MRQKTSSSDTLLKVRSSRKKYILKLYVCGMTVRSTLAIDNIQKVCRGYLQGCYDLEIIDIFKYPAQAREAQVIAAPTLIRQSPLPVHRLVGSMSDIQKVLSGLDLISFN
jgi:circadian clock protein KaiB